MFMGFRHELFRSCEVAAKHEPHMQGVRVIQIGGLGVHPQANSQFIIICRYLAYGH